MPNPFSRLPLHSLMVFEAAARHGKFVIAAGELQMTQGRVSQHIGDLEKLLGVPLFQRHYRGVELTSAGQDLLRSVRQGLQTLSDGVDAAMRLKTSRTLNILADFGFAAWWLAPRLDSLRARLPEAEIRLLTVQSGTDVTNIDYDLAVLFGGASMLGARSRLLVREEVYPVCAPACLAERGLPPEDLSDMLARSCLLELCSTGEQSWFGWEDWLKDAGIAVSFEANSLKFNNYHMVLQAALWGQGVALGWAPLIDGMVAEGRLLRLADRPLTSERGYFLIESPRRRRSHLTGQAAAWLEEAIAEPAEATVMGRVEN